MADEDAHSALHIEDGIESIPVDVSSPTFDRSLCHVTVGFMQLAHVSASFGISDNRSVEATLGHEIRCRMRQGWKVTNEAIDGLMDFIESSSLAMVARPAGTDGAEGGEGAGGSDDYDFYVRYDVPESGPGQKGGE